MFPIGGDRWRKEEEGRREERERRVVKMVKSGVGNKSRNFREIFEEYHY
jgi:hypothetical protein